MSERVVVYLNENLDYVELNGMPAWVDTSRYDLGSASMPARSRFMPGQDGLVYSQRNNERFVYVGVLRNVHIDREGRALTFERFERFARPVLIEQGDESHTREVYVEGKGYMNAFAYVPEAALDEAIRRSHRQAPTR
jgi:hypothetical protein